MLLLQLVLYLHSTNLQQVYILDPPQSQTKRGQCIPKAGLKTNSNLKFSPVLLSELLRFLR